MIDVLETNKLPSAAAGISVEARLQIAGKPTAEGASISPYVHWLPDDKVFICGLLFKHGCLSCNFGIMHWMWQFSEFSLHRTLIFIFYFFKINF